MLQNAKLTLPDARELQPVPRASESDRDAMSDKLLNLQESVIPLTHTVQRTREFIKPDNALNVTLIPYIRIQSTNTLQSAVL